MRDFVLGTLFPFFTKIRVPPWVPRPEFGLSTFKDKKKLPVWAALSFFWVDGYCLGNRLTGLTAHARTWLLIITTRTSNKLIRIISMDTNDIAKPYRASERLEKL
jgi:hypothetical protein